MNGFLAGLLAALPNALMAIFTKLFSQAFLEAVIKKITIYGLEILAKKTENKLDDELLEDIKKQLNA